MNSIIEIPHSLLPVLSLDNQNIKMLCFYFHLKEHFGFPSFVFKSDQVRILSSSTGWSSKTIYNRLNQLKKAKIVIPEGEELRLLHSDLLFEKLLPRFKKTPFQLIQYSPYVLELKIKALPLYLHYLRQQYRIECKLKKYLGTRYTPELSAEIKIRHLRVLKSQPYCVSEVKFLPILTLQKAAELMNRRSTATVHSFISQLNQAGLVTIHKMRKKQIRSRWGKLKDALEEPPSIIFFNDM